MCCKNKKHYHYNECFTLYSKHFFGNWSSFSCTIQRFSSSICKEAIVLVISPAILKYRNVKHNIRLSIRFNLTMMEYNIAYPLRTWRYIRLYPRTSIDHSLLRFSPVHLRYFQCFWDWDSQPFLKFHLVFRLAFAVWWSPFLQYFWDVTGVPSCSTSKPSKFFGLFWVIFLWPVFIFLFQIKVSYDFADSF